MAKIAIIYEEKAANYESQMSGGITTLRANNYSVPEGETARDFRALVADKQDIRRMLFCGFGKCLYRVQKFDSDSERRFAMVLENDREVLKWIKPARGQFKIFYAGDESYEPDFVVETRTAKFLCEPKAANEMNADDVRAKARAAVEWCRNASAYELDNGGKPWSYLLIPHDVIADNMTLAGLASRFTFSA